MDEHILKTRLHDIQDDILRLNNAAFALEASNYKNYPDNFLEFSLDTAVRAEKIACKLRSLIGGYGSVKKDLLMERIEEAHGITVGQDGEIIVVTIPRLLPKYKKVRSGEFINQPLYYAMSKYCDEHNIAKLRKCAVCFVHIYDEKLGLGRIRDYDNMEIKNILNTVATFFMTDDSGLFCDAYHTTEFGESDCTRIYVMPQTALPGFILELKNPPKSISNFEGNT
ncbi:MAG: DUF6100 family protein [Oscillospiraceae bacterium]|jgi:hypothetical protein|nr:DUF6100 family protein [Oscillospiraceae bacterium]